MTVSIRPATTADARGIAALNVRTWQVAYADYLSAKFLSGMQVDESEVRWGRLITEAGVSVLVAVEEDRIIGFCSYGANRDELGDGVGEIYTLYVDPDYWTRGVGTLLLQTAEAGLIEAVYERAILWTLAPNDPTRRFYEHRDWRFDETKEAHRLGVELVRYTKTLTPDERSPQPSA